MGDGAPVTAEREDVGHRVKGDIPCSESRGGRAKVVEFMVLEVGGGQQRRDLGVSMLRLYFIYC